MVHHTNQTWSKYYRTKILYCKRRVFGYNNFVFRGVLAPLKDLLLMWRRHNFPWRPSNFDLYSALIAAEQRGFFKGANLMWHVASVYMISSEDTWLSHLLSSVWQWSCQYLFSWRRSIVAGIQTTNIPHAMQTQVRPLPRQKFFFKFLSVFQSSPRRFIWWGKCWQQTIRSCRCVVCIKYLEKIWECFCNYTVVTYFGNFLLLLVNHYFSESFNTTYFSD